MSNKLYDFLKPVALYILPGLGALYFTLSKIWNLPYAEQVVGTVMAIDVFLGVLLQVNNAAYQKSQVVGEIVPQEVEIPQVPEDMPKFHMSKEVYDALYWVAQILLPACGTLYFALAGVWGWPYPQQVVATIAAIDTFLGVVLAVSTYQYKQAMAKMLEKTGAPEMQ